MKVDTQRMEAARLQLMELQRRIAQMEHEIMEIRSVLQHQKFGSSSRNEVIAASLLKQSQVLGQREEGIGRLANTLQSAMEQYQRCETEARQAGSTGNDAQSPISLKDVQVVWYHGIKTISPIQEHQIIHKYLTPLLGTGKKETT